MIMYKEWINRTMETKTKKITIHKIRMIKTTKTNKIKRQGNLIIRLV